MSLSVLDLWDQGPPGGGVQYSAPEIFADQTGEDQRLNRVYSHVRRPTLTVHRPAPERATGAAVVVFPGGAYRDVWIDKEGYDVARWLNLFGVTAIVVKYRTEPANPQEQVRDAVRRAALADARRALRLARHHAVEWDIDPRRLGTIGFSAGGNLIVRLALHADGGQLDAADPVERQSCIPAFTIPVYPAVPQDLSDLGTGTGPMFIVHGSRDALVPPLGSLRLYRALLEAGVPVELHIFGQGEHGFGLGITGGTARRWPDLCEEWMRDLGFLVS